MERFSCRDEGVQRYLNAQAFDFDKRNFARTYLIFDQSDFERGNFNVIAYYTLSIKVLRLSNALSKQKIKKIDGLSKDAQFVGALLIGQFGKDANFGADFSGSELMQYAMNIVYSVHELAACRIVFLECQQLPALTDFYRRQDFVDIQTNEKNGLLQMVRFL
jgi:hypothetical protein